MSTLSENRLFKLMYIKKSKKNVEYLLKKYVKSLFLITRNKKIKFEIFMSISGNRGPVIKKNWN